MQFVAVKRVVYCCNGDKVACQESNLLCSSTQSRLRLKKNSSEAHYCDVEVIRLKQRGGQAQDGMNVILNGVLTNMHAST